MANSGVIGRACQREAPRYRLTQAKRFMAGWGLRRLVPVEFDLQKYLRASRKVAIDDLDWERVHEHPLHAGEIRFLRYMMNIEAHTIVYHKELLSTRAIEDNDVAGFLACWNYEEYFHGAALEKFLRTYAGDAAATHSATERLSYGSGFGRFAKKLATPLVGLATPDFAATHMAWGATQELTTLHGYESLARQSRHPVLKELMSRIVRDERRHFAFYFNQAESRLLAEPRAQKFTRWAMDKLWRPVGVGAMPAVESDFTSWYLFRDAEGQAALQEVQSTIARLPGMEGWTTLTKAINAGIQATDRRDPGLTTSAYQFAPPAPRATAGLAAA